VMIYCDVLWIPIVDVTPSMWPLVQLKGGC
jgi:hypothetical protein